LLQFELPEGVQTAQYEFDQQLALELENMADRIENKDTLQNTRFAFSADDLEQVVSRCAVDESFKALATRRRTFLLLSRNIKTLVRSLDNEIRIANRES
jgi:hypothetical protein